MATEEDTAAANETAEGEGETKRDSKANTENEKPPKKRKPRRQPCTEDPPPPRRTAFSVRKDELGEVFKIRSILPLKEPFLVRYKNKHMLRKGIERVISYSELPRKCKEKCIKLEKRRGKKEEKVEEKKEEEPSEETPNEGEEQS